MKTLVLARYLTAPGAPPPEDGAATDLTMTADQSLRVNVTGGTISPATTVLLADDMANPTVPLGGSFLLGFDGVTWDRLRTASPASATITLGAGALTTISALFQFDSQSGLYRRTRCDNNGQQLVTNGKPPVTTTDQITRSYQANVSAVNLKATSAQLYSVRASNGTATGLFACVCNRTTAPVNGDAVYDSVFVPAFDHGHMGPEDWGLQGDNLSSGFSIAWSSTPEAITLPASGTNLVMTLHYQ